MSKHQHTPASAAVGIEHAIRMLEGRWKLVILFHLFGGTCAWTMRATMPSRSSCRSCWISIFCETAGIARSRSEKRSFLPSKRWKDHELPATFQHPDRVLDPDCRRRGRVLMLTHG